MKKNTEQEQRRNFWIAVFQGVFMRISLAFIESGTILSAFVLRLTGSHFLVGLAGSIMPAGWMWPQLLMSNILEHRPRKMPFYKLGMSIRVVAWLTIVGCTLLIEPHRKSVLVATFFCFYFIAASSMGISSIPYMEIVSKSIQPQRRARFFSIRQFIGGGLAFFIGEFLIKFVLSDASGVTFPHNYALLFSFAVVATLAAFLVFLLIREPIQLIKTKRKSFRQHLRQGTYLLRTDIHYRRFIIFRIFAHSAGMCMPFYVPYALLKLGVPDSTIGSFLAVVALSGAISTALWGHVGEKYGARWILIGMSAFGCVPPLVAIFVPMLPLPWQIPSYFLIFAVNGISINGMMVGFMTYMLNVAPPLIRPSYLGFMNTLLFPFSFVTVLGGVVVSRIGYQGVFTISLGLSLLAFTMTTRLEEVFYNEEIQSDDEIM